MVQQAYKSCGQCSGSGSDEQPRCRQGCCGSCSCKNREIAITKDERDFLELLGTIPFLPLARFLQRSTNPGQPDIPVLSPVYLDSADDPPEAVQKAGLILRSLETKRLITLDYDQPLLNGDYSMYERSAAYSQFYRETREDAGFPVLELGSIALTALGQSALDSLSVTGE